MLKELAKIHTLWIVAFIFLGIAGTVDCCFGFYTIGIATFFAALVAIVTGYFTRNDRMRW